MRRTLLSLFFFLFTISIHASHLIGYDMNLINIKDAVGQPTNMYKVRVKFYRDMSGTVIPGSFTFNIYKNSDNSIVGQPIITPKINAANTPLSYGDTECAPFGFSGQRVEYGLYESAPVDLSGLNHPGGYYMSTNLNARNPGIINTEGGPSNSSMYSLTLTMDFPRLDALSPYKYNSSPEFIETPLTYFCVGKPYTINWNVIDPDNTIAMPRKDSLVYSMTQPLGGFGQVKPWSANVIPYASGYGLNTNIADGAPDISIDSRTGIVNYIPTKQGKYLVAFKCEEYRNGVKIGEIRRELQIETVLCNENPPITEDREHHSRYITDTVYFGDPNFSMTFTSVDAPTDSLTMEYVQTIQDNLINQGALFEDLITPGIQTWKIEDVYTVKGRFKWRVGCEDIRSKPYKFYVVVHDRTCPSPFYDTTYVTLYARMPYTNYRPLFVSLDTFVDNHHAQRYIIEAGSYFVLDSNTILKAIDTNKFVQNITITGVPDIQNPPGFNGQYSFHSFSSDRLATAIFEWTPSCELARNSPYKIQFIAYDDDCFPDTAKLNVELYVVPPLNQVPLMYIYDFTHQIKKDTIVIPAYDTLQFTLKGTDIRADSSSNKYYLVSAGVYQNDFSSFDVQGGAQPSIPSVSAIENVSTEFTWTPNQANVRSEPYRLPLYVHDNGCPYPLYAYKEIFIRVTSSTGVGHHNADQENITVYPNPTSTNLFINAGNVHITDMEVINIQGKKVTSAEKPFNRLDVSHLSEGIYFLKIYSEEGLIVKKVNIIK